MMFKETRRGPNNGFDNTELRFSDRGTKKILLGVVDSKEFDRFQTLRNNSQQHATTYNRKCKRTQHVTAKRCCEFTKTFRPFAYD